MKYFGWFEFGKNITVLRLKVVWYEAKETVPSQNWDEKIMEKNNWWNITKGYFRRSVLLQSVCANGHFDFVLFYLFIFSMVIKLTSYDRQNEPINHRLRAGQESSHFRLPMKAVRLLWTRRSSSHVPCPLPSFRRTLLSVRAKFGLSNQEEAKGAWTLSELHSCDTSFPPVYRLCQADPPVPADLTPLFRDSVPQTFF